jgi:thiol-disulfide isomerase/thioredoxin
LAFPLLVGLFICVPAGAVLEKGASFVPFALKNYDGRAFTLTLEDGRLTLLSEETRDGRTSLAKSHPAAVLLDFWATWCVPCRAAMPYMQQLHDKYKPAEGQETGGLRLFGVALDLKGSLVVKPFYAKLKYTYPMLADPTTAAAGDTLVRTTQDMKAKYKVQDIPVVYLIDAKGTITHVHVGFKKEFIAEIEAAVVTLVKGEAK